MKYAKEVIDLLSSHPHRWFKRREIVRYVLSHDSRSTQRGVVVGVQRVLKQLQESSYISIRKTLCESGSGFMYKRSTRKRHMNYLKAAQKAAQ